MLMYPRNFAPGEARKELLCFMGACARAPGASGAQTRAASRFPTEDLYSTFSVLDDAAKALGPEARAAFLSSEDDLCQGRRRESAPLT